jgi:DNA-binding response OmpR family regulator
LRQVNILYVEDYDLVLFTVKQLLELEGWCVDVCRDGSTALQMFEAATDYDLIVLDYELPGARGLDLLRKARSLPALHATPIIMFTASECEAESLEAGADAFLKKPGGIRELIPTIELLLNGQRRTEEPVNHSTFKSLR